MNKDLTYDELQMKLIYVLNVYTSELSVPGAKTRQHSAQVEDDYQQVFRALQTGNYDFNTWTNSGQTLLHTVFGSMSLCPVSLYILKNAGRFDVPDRDGYLPHQTAAIMDSAKKLQFMVEERNVDPFMTTWARRTNVIALAGRSRSIHCLIYLAHKFNISPRLLEFWAPKPNTPPTVFSVLFNLNFGPEALKQRLAG